ncbi:hypothetical protein BYT27DRAFT_7254985 [Phlegmacium glaucopus]|nr:hypothetical protein BYT27DRAFT_7254985 [Phlegmacium glaucopus]
MNLAELSDYCIGLSLSAVPSLFLLYCQSNLSDPITSTLLETLFRRYVDELRYICATHTLSDVPGVRLLEAEVVIGTILAKCSQKRWRTNRIYRIRLHASALVQEVRRNLIESMESTVSELIAGLQLAWSAWDLSLRRRNEFAANSFGLIALVQLNCEGVAR